jgi:hypothetical protein
MRGRRGARFMAERILDMNGRKSTDTGRLTNRSSSDGALKTFSRRPTRYAMQMTVGVRTGR